MIRLELSSRWQASEVEVVLSWRSRLRLLLSGRVLLVRS